MAGTLLAIPADDGGAGVKVLVVCVMALRFAVALEDGFPADQAAAVVWRSDAHADEDGR